jgi:hypothetical protein
MPKGKCQSRCQYPCSTSLNRRTVSIQDTVRFIDTGNNQHQAGLQTWAPKNQGPEYRGSDSSGLSSGRISVWTAILRGLLLLARRRRVTRFPHSSRHTQTGQDEAHHHKPSHKHNYSQYQVRTQDIHVSSLSRPYPIAASSEGWCRSWLWPGIWARSTPNREGPPPNCTSLCCEMDSGPVPGAGSALGDEGSSEFRPNTTLVRGPQQDIH